VHNLVSQYLKRLGELKDMLVEEVMRGNPDGDSQYRFYVGQYQAYITAEQEFREIAAKHPTGEE